MRKSKGQTVDFLYTSKENKDKKSKTKSKKNTKKQTARKETINLDNEIIIGLTPKKEEKKTSNKKTKNNTKTKTKKSAVDTKKRKTKANKTVNHKRKKTLKIVKWIFVLLFFITAITLFMLSSVFNIKEIKVINNSKISKDEIINLSTLKTEENMFKTINKNIVNGIKTNAYIENVKVKRNLKGTITLDVKERVSTYMLKFANAYVYINNQGYMLEMSETPIELPIITGFSTPAEEIKEGNRLVVDDLKKLDDIIKIFNSAKEKTFGSKITSIDISDATNYKLTIESENKEIEFGDLTNINIKLLRIEEVIEKEKGEKGVIYFQNTDKTVFRKTV